MSALGHLKSKTIWSWRTFWASQSRASSWGRFASKLAAIGTAPLHGKACLSDLGPRGFISHLAGIKHDHVSMSKGCLLGDGSLIYADRGDGKVVLEKGALCYGQTLLRTGQGGSIIIGKDSHIQHQCTLVACVGDIIVGEKVEIAANCSIYAFNHGFEGTSPIMEQKLTSKGPIEIGDGAWLGDGVKVLDGAKIGKGAIIGAGAVVRDHIPDYAIAVGVPAKVVAQRSEPLTTT